MSANPTALEVETLAAEWIERRFFGAWSETEQKELDAWLAQSLAHRIAFVRINSGWQRTERLAVLQSPMRDAPVRAVSREPWLKFFRLAAAAIVIAATSGAVTFVMSRSSENTYATHIGEREVLSLADGSEIELNTNTVLRTAVTPSRRTVWLERGEAFFRVKHDASHPFVVMVGGRRITDLGTKFSIRSDSGRLQVAVVEGVVQYDDPTQQHTAASRILRQGDVVVATNASTSVLRRSPHELADELGWRRGVLIFDRTPLSEAAEEINRYNHKKLVIADPVAARMKIGGTFPKNNVNAITAAARELFGLHVEDRGDQIVITRR